MEDKNAEIKALKEDLKKLLDLAGKLTIALNLSKYDHDGFEIEWMSRLELDALYVLKSYNATPDYAKETP